MFKGVPTKISHLFPKYLMGFGLDPQSDHLKKLYRLMEKKPIKRILNTIK